MGDLAPPPRPHIGPLSAEGIGLGVFVVFAAIMLPSYQSAGAIIALLGAALAVAAALRRGLIWVPDTFSAGRVTIVGLAATIVFLVAGQLGLDWLKWWERPHVMFAVTLLALGAWLWLRRATITRREGLLWLAILLGVAALAGAAPALFAEGGLDVWWLHHEAARFLAAGENPYSAVVVFDGSPLQPEGAAIVGYPYPPLTMILYSLGQWLGGDPRWTSLVAVLAIAAILGLVPRRRGGLVVAAGLAAALVFLAQPSLLYLIATAWTEPVSIPLLAAAAFLWRRNPTWSAVVLGLAFATKQYFILALPILLLIPDEARWKRMGITAGVAAATLLPFVLLDFGAFWNATVDFLVTRPPRPDSANLVGLGVESPTWLVVGVTVLVAVISGRLVRRGSDLLAAIAGTLAVLFVFSYQAFANYWFLVGTLSLLAVAFRFDSEPATAKLERVAVEDAPTV